MLKISEPVIDGTVTLKLEGRLVGPWVGELKQSCESHLIENRSINLDFADVTFADHTGIALLLRLRANGVGLLNCSPFLEEELRTASAET